MTTIAASELSARIEEVLARVRAGETVLVEDQGAALAQIAPCTRVEAIEKDLPGTKRANDDDSDGVPPLADWEKALGIRNATKHARDVHIHRIPLPPGVDILDILEEVRSDRDLLS